MPVYVCFAWSAIPPFSFFLRLRATLILLPEATVASLFLLMYNRHLARRQDVHVVEKIDTYLLYKIRLKVEDDLLREDR
jgi:hypothetical protein